MKTTTFFSQFTDEQIKRQYKSNLEGLTKMLNKAILTGKKVNGYTTDQLSAMVEQYTELAK